MGCSIDAAGETGNDPKPGLAEITRQALPRTRSRRQLRFAHPRWQPSARASTPVCPSHRDDGGRIVDHFRRGGYSGSPIATRLHAHRARNAFSSRSASERESCERTSRAAAAREVRHCFQRGARTADSEISARKVHGPTLSLRISWSQSSRCSSVRRTSSLRPLSLMSRRFSRSVPGARRLRFDRCLIPQQHREQRIPASDFRLMAEHPQHDRHDGARNEARQGTNSG